MGPRALRGSTLDLPAKLGALTWLKNDPAVDSGPHPGVHQQGRLALKEPGPAPLDFSVWSILESKACRTSHDSLENLQTKLQREWALIPQEVLCASYNAFQGRLKQIIKNKGGHIK